MAVFSIISLFVDAFCGAVDLIDGFFWQILWLSYVMTDGQLIRCILYCFVTFSLHILETSRSLIVDVVCCYLLLLMVPCKILVSTCGFWRLFAYWQINSVHSSVWWHILCCWELCFFDRFCSTKPVFHDALNTPSRSKCFHYVGFFVCLFTRLFKKIQLDFLDDLYYVLDPVILFFSAICSM